MKIKIEIKMKCQAGNKVTYLMLSRPANHHIFATFAQ